MLHSEKSQRSLEKWLVPGMGYQLQKTWLEYLVVSESRAVLKKKKKKSDTVCLKDTGTNNMKEHLMAKSRKTEKENNDTVSLQHKE